MSPIPDNNRGRRVPPNNMMAERSVLGGILLRNDYLTDAVSVLAPDDFYYPDNRLIYSAMLELVREHKPIDLLTLSDHLEVKGLLKDAGGIDYISGLGDEAPLEDVFHEHLDIVVKKSKLRQMIAGMTEVISACYGDSSNIDELIDLTTKRLYDIRESHEAGFVPLGTVIADRMNQIAKIQASGENDSIRSGYTSIDETLGGLKKGSLIIIAARPGMGKTALALNIAYKAAMFFNTVTAVFSLEMSRAEVAHRIISAHLLIDSKHLNNAKLTDEDWERVTENFARFGTTPIHIDDRSGITAVDMLSKCRQLKMKENLGLVIVDYLQLMSGDGSRRDNRQQEIADISRQLKIMARELEVPVIALSQLSRQAERHEDSRPQLSHLRDSGAIEQDADAVLMIYRDKMITDSEIPPETQPAEIIVAKNRHGETKTLHMDWIPRYTLFREPYSRPVPEEPAGALPKAQDFPDPEPPPETEDTISADTDLPFD